MLCLTRKKGETITIGGVVEVTVVRDGARVMLGINAPKGITISRGTKADQADQAKKGGK